ncbi:MAG: hydroxyacylglutathione hydrolase [Halothece sp. Uz-M2-17]|nr:hydroxyacylglutathione hydrolase [Halothece sp. Uz-M2-17]
MEVKRLPALSDNYIFVLYDPEQNIAATVDPAEAKPVLNCLQKLGAELVAIFNTHHHFDHVGGNQELKKHYPQAVVYGSAADQGRIPHQEVFLQEGDTVTFGGRSGEVFFVPGHTSGHIAYYFPPAGGQAVGELFAGDTMFVGGCGRLFEGTPNQMVDSLSKLKNLPDQTRLWCAHEYTLKNYQFAISIEPNNPVVQRRYQEVQQARRDGKATVPSLLEQEKETNPFLRWDDQNLQTIAQSHDPAQTFGRLRGMKDRF